MEKRDTSYFSASNINEIIFQLDHNTILSTIPLIKEKFRDMVLIDALINNNNRNEDNWGVIKHKSERLMNLHQFMIAEIVFTEKQVKIE